MLILKCRNRTCAFAKWIEWRAYTTTQPGESPSHLGPDFGFCPHLLTSTYLFGQPIGDCVLRFILPVPSEQHVPAKLATISSSRAACCSSGACHPAPIVHASPPPPSLTLQCSISAILHMSDPMPRAASPTRIGAPRSISRLRRLCRSCRLPAVLPHSYCFWCWPCRCCPKPSPCSLLTMHPGAGRPAAANHLGGAPLSIDHLLLDVSLRPATAAVLPRPLLAASSRCWTCDCGWPPRRCFPPLTRCAGRPAAAGHRADAPSPHPYRLTCGSC